LYRVFWSAADIIIFRRSLYCGLAIDEVFSKLNYNYQK